MTVPVGYIIRKLREEKGISQSELSRNAGLAQSYLSNIEAGLKSPTVRTLQKIAAALSVPLAFLLKDEESGGSKPLDQAAAARDND